MSSEHLQATKWRERHGWTKAALSQLLGYAPETIYWMERGETPPGRAGKKKPQPVKPWVWQRYKRACQGLDAEVRAKAPFQW